MNLSVGAADFPAPASVYRRGRRARQLPARGRRVPCGAAVAQRAGRRRRTGARRAAVRAQRTPRARPAGRGAAGGAGAPDPGRRRRSAGARAAAGRSLPRHAAARRDPDDLPVSAARHRASAGARLPAADDRVERRAHRPSRRAGQGRRRSTPPCSRSRPICAAWCTRRLGLGSVPSGGRPGPPAGARRGSGA